MEHPFIQYLLNHDLIPASASRCLSNHTCMIREPIGMIAVGHGLLGGPQIDKILDEQRGCSDRFGEIAIRLGFLTAEQVETLVKIQEFRTAVSITEALALAGIIKYEDAVRYLGRYFTHDEEILDIMAAQ